MTTRPIVVDDTQQELTPHGTAEFPMSVDHQRVADDLIARIPHWHYEIQISVAIRGSVCFRTPVGDLLAHEGEGIFLNSSVLHEIVPTEEEDSEYVCINFRPSLIYGDPASMIRRDYTDPFLFSRALQAFLLTEEPWHRDVTRAVLAMSALDEKKEYGYELLMQTLLGELWHTILIHNREVIEGDSSVTFTDRQRMKALQEFIKDNYAEPLRLADIAEAGHISRGECCRLFARVLDTSPMAYLKEFRIAQSLKLLASTELTIAEIAQHTGFNTSSYFTKCFKEEMTTTPLHYRKQNAG